jgi:transcriptional regulator with XRE-family HTH domain
MTTFGEEMRRLTAERGLSLRTLARRTHYHVSYLSKVMNGHKRASADLAEAIDRELGADGALASLAAEQARARLLTPDDEERLILAARRPSRTDAQVIDSLAGMLAGQRRLEDAVGSSQLIEPVKTQLTVIGGLVLDARGPVRPRLVDVAAQWAQFCGWLHASTGQLVAARAWFDRAAEWAAEADNVDMSAAALSFKGHLAWMAGQVGPMIGLSQAAQRDPNVYPGQRAFDSQQEARGHAMAGDGNATDRKLDDAASLSALAAERPEDQPPWMYYHSPAFLALQRGLAYRYLGRDDPARNARAIETLTRGLAELPAEIRRAEWVTDYLHQLVLAHAQAGEPEQACAAAGKAASIALDTHSVRVPAQLRRLHARLAAAYPDVQAVDELGELLHSTNGHNRSPRS